MKECKNIVREVTHSHTQQNDSIKINLISCTHNRNDLFLAVFASASAHYLHVNKYVRQTTYTNISNRGSFTGLYTRIAWESICYSTRTMHRYRMNSVPNSGRVFCPTKPHRRRRRRKENSIYEFRLHLIDMYGISVRYCMVAQLLLFRVGGSSCQFIKLVIYTHIAMGQLV